MGTPQTISRDWSDFAQTQTNLQSWFVMLVDTRNGGIIVSVTLPAERTAYTFDVPHWLPMEAAKINVLPLYEGWNKYTPSPW